jgi:hypothetical protein
MNQTGIAEQMTSFYKTTYDNGVKAMNTLQEQTAKVVDLSLEQSPWLPEQSKNFINTWVRAYSEGYDNFMSAADEQYKRLEALFDPGRDARQDDESAPRTYRKSDEPSSGPITPASRTTKSDLTGAKA